MSETTETPVSDGFDDLDDVFGTSERETEEGKWFKVGKNAEFKLRRFNSKKSNKVRAALDAQYKSAFKVVKMPDELLEKITNEHIAVGIIVDWRGIKLNGEPLKYSKANAIAILEKYPDLRNIVADYALQLENWREGTKDALEGN